MILVTGGTGTVGRHLVRELTARKANFRVAARDAARAHEVLGPKVNSVPFDFDDVGSMRRAFDSARKVFLLSPPTERGREQAITAIDAARAAGVQYLVRMSALGADDNPGYLLGRPHREVELYLLASGVSGTILRPNSFMENLLGPEGAAMRSEGRLYAPLGEARVSYIAARDIAAVAATMLTTEGYEDKSYDLTGPEAVSMAEVAEALTRALGRTITYVDVPDDAVRQAMAGAPPALIEGIVDLYAYNRSGAMAKVTGSVEEITGRPAQDIRSWAEHNAAAFA